jgi:BTB/POZ domain
VSARGEELRGARMSGEKQYFLRWSNFSDNIVTSLERLRGDEDFVDVTLACEGHSLKAHKVVLSACSQYIKKLLKDNPCAHPIIILKDVALAELTALISFMYNGQVSSFSIFGPGFGLRWGDEPFKPYPTRLRSEYPGNAKFQGMLRVVFEFFILSPQMISWLDLVWLQFDFSTRKEFRSTQI